MSVRTTMGHKKRSESNWMVHCLAIHPFPLGPAGFSDTQLLLIQSILNKQLILEILLNVEMMNY